MDHLVNLVMTSALEQKGWEWSYEATRRLIGFICTDDAAWKRSNSDQNNSKVVAGGNESDVNFDNTILGRDDQGFPTCPTNKRNFEDFKADSKDPSIDKNSKKAKEGIFVFKTINLSGEEDWKPLSLENVFQNLVAQSKDGICVKKVPTSVSIP